MCFPLFLSFAFTDLELFLVYFVTNDILKLRKLSLFQKADRIGRLNHILFMYIS